MTHPTTNPASRPAAPFAEFLLSRAPRSPLRNAVSAAHYRPEAECVDALLPRADLTPEQDRQATRVAHGLAEAARDSSPDIVGSLLQAYPLSSPEGQSVLALEEALLRIPDSATQDALIRSLVGATDWGRHISKRRASVVNSIALNLSLAGRFNQSKGFSLRRLTLQTSTPMVRRSLEKAIRAVGSGFILGSTLAQALRLSAPAEKYGLTYAYDPQVNTALTAHQALDALTVYEDALEDISQHAGITGDFHNRPILYVRLPALSARFSRFRRERIMTELLPILQRLTIRARQLDVGILLSSEDSTHLELTLDLLEALCVLPELGNWNGLGMTVQTYDRRASAVVDFLIDLGRRTGRRVLVRLVKGSCWNSEIRQAQKTGLADFPVFTRRCHTDVSYLACARQLLESLDATYPQFATHNPRTIGHILALAGQVRPGDFEFACLQGLGLALAQHLRNQQGMNLPCRVHAPIGEVAALMPSFVRQLLENGAASLVVSRDEDPAITIEALTADPVEATRAILRTERPNRAVRAPSDIFQPGRRNAAGLDLFNELTLRALHETLDGDAPFLHARALTPGVTSQHDRSRLLYNPADRHDPIGDVVETDGKTLLSALETAEHALASWAGSSPEVRIACLGKAADLIEAHRIELMALLVREAGKTLPAAQDEVREAVSILRHDAERLQGRDYHLQASPLGLVACISPWSSPLAAFVQQISVSLAAGNVILAKPAEQTPFIASRTIQLLHDAGIPPEVLHLLPGDGSVGERLVADHRVDAVMFTGSTPVGKAVSRQIFDRQGRTGTPVPLVARTGGQNAMLVDSSAHAEQVVQDILSSAFDSAGQRCSSLRILLIQEDCADHVLELLKGAIQDLAIGNPARLSTDIGPIISPEARTEAMDHIEMMRRAGRTVWSPELGENCRYGHFLPPTLIEIGRVADIPHEVFGPVLHVRRFNRSEMDGVIDAVNSMGYGLTFGVHSRVAMTVDRTTNRIQAGNIYVNRAITGAVIGSQPFGGSGLSGCGPKAGGPFALRRMSARTSPWFAPKDANPGSIPRHAQSLVTFLESRDAVSARQIRQDIAHAMTGFSMALPGPSGETNTLTLKPCGPVLCAGESWPAILRAVGMALGTGNPALVLGPDHALDWMQRLSPGLADRIQRVDPGALPECAVMIMERHSPRALQAASTLTAREGRIVPIHVLDCLRPEWLLEEHVVTVNTAALCGDLTTMALS
ncbi:bifunctional proline dehydrogenase/L-glutamate gamma-semialdehyde dehydrogenase PutA [Gluconobacter cerinus]|uniref:bifunctional proline dehydrogenase/L-glutamate gamma-semialdehyde dehydrogenase PutA n=1 Tax=Gluconobacter cerinus TaxID=38307 RepID=UPI001B8DA6B6|nr:bifunctional proline dehydrogenase/L-glutamate gamma-semialdehyde dehydrogenase PutA [Gluconobacter cerinus]MBS1068088.1 bifunctional proline dehydrogenase/L-glutamate gamma-semialdehyde dehydrogenase PutA [Gluconobacter cerinus]